MKASEMIKALEEAIERHGDCDLVILDGYVFVVTGPGDEDIEGVADIPPMGGGISGFPPPERE